MPYGSIGTHVLSAFKLQEALIREDVVSSEAGLMPKLGPLRHLRDRTTQIPLFVTRTSPEHHRL
jgi:hypothetical protein